jgi:hypothetical protein
LSAAAGSGDCQLPYQTLLAQDADVAALLPISGVKRRLDEAGEIADTATLRRIAETVAALADPTL